MGFERKKSAWTGSFARLAVCLLALLTISFALVACGSSGSSSSSESATTGEETEATTGGGEEAEEGGEESSSGSLKEAEEATEAAFKGQFGTPPTEPNPAVKGKTVWVISPGQASAPAAAISAAAITAAKDLGWNATLCDGKLNPSVEADCFKSAIAANAEGILGVATDCPTIKAQLNEATAAKILVVPIFSFDCDEVGDGPAQFSTQISFGNRYKTAREFFEATGEDGAAYVVSENNGEANVLSMNNPEYYDLKFWQAGFESGMEKYCSSCSLESIEYLAAEFGPGLQEKVATGLTKNPEINAIQMTWNPELGPEAAVEASGRAEEITTLGGLGVAADTAAVESGSIKGVIAQPLPWWGFAAADTLNSLFAGKEPRDEGIGWQLFTKEQNLPAKGEEFTGPVDFEAAYKKSWGS
jgi:ribose transport system substrate-binding protein